jgi:hypothetical protein
MRSRQRVQRFTPTCRAPFPPNLCVVSRLRELLEQGFEVAVLKDATATPRAPNQ